MWNSNAPSATKSNLSLTSILTAGKRLGSKPTASSVTTTEDNGCNSGTPGMTLLDYRAAKAMQGMLADLPPSLYGPDWQEKLVSSSYTVADAMLKERTKWIE